MSHPETDNARPTLGRGPAAKGAIDAVTAFVAELQAGWDRHDADISNRHFAADVAWGSPYGATVHGYEQLHTIHQRLKAQGTGGPSSRFEIDRVLPLTDDVVVAHVARRALGPDGQPLEPSDNDTKAFSEMALYVLVHRDGTWWLAAGQNTPVRPGGAA